MTDQQRWDLTPLLIRMARRYHLSARAAADADPVFRRFWEQGDKDKLPRAEAWLSQAAPAIAERLTVGQDCPPDRQRNRVTHEPCTPRGRARFIRF
jgi:hypothetical protein